MWGSGPSWGSLPWGTGGTAPHVGLNGRVLPLVPQRPGRIFQHWQTALTRTRDGTERRAAIATKPFERYEFTYLLDDDEIRAVRAEFARYPADLRLVPLPHQQLVALAAVTGYEITVKTTTLSDFLGVGRRLLVYNEATRTAYVGVVQSTTATTITLDVVPPSGTYPAVVTSVMPIMACVVQQPVTTSRHAVNASLFTIKAQRCEVDPAHGTGSAAIATYDSRYLLDQIPIQRGTTDEQTDAAVDVVDFGMRPESYFSAGILGVNQRALSFLVQTDAQRQFWRSFLYTMRGRQKMFLLSTHRPDLEVAVQPTGVSLTVYDAYFSTYLGLSEITRRLAITLEDGSIVYRKVSAYLDNGDGTETLTLTSALDTGVVGDITKISFLEQVRLATDDVAWDLEPGSSFVSFSVVSCPA